MSSLAFGPRRPHPTHPQPEPDQNAFKIVRAMNRTRLPWNSTFETSCSIHYILIPTRIHLDQRYPMPKLLYHLGLYLQPYGCKCLVSKIYISERSDFLPRRTRRSFFSLRVSSRSRTFLYEDSYWNKRRKRKGLIHDQPGNSTFFFTIRISRNPILRRYHSLLTPNTKRLLLDIGIDDSNPTVESPGINVDLLLFNSAAYSTRRLFDIAASHLQIGYDLSTHNPDSDDIITEKKTFVDQVPPHFFRLFEISADEDIFQIKDFEVRFRVVGADSWVIGHVFFKPCIRLNLDNDEEEEEEEGEEREGENEVTNDSIMMKTQFHETWKFSTVKLICFHPNSSYNSVTIFETFLEQIYYRDLAAKSSNDDDSSHWKCVRSVLIDAILFQVADRRMNRRENTARDLSCQTIGLKEFSRSLQEGNLRTVQERHVSKRFGDVILDNLIRNGYVHETEERLQITVYSNVTLGTTRVLFRRPSSGHRLSFDCLIRDRIGLNWICTHSRHLPLDFKLDVRRDMVLSAADAVTALDDPPLFEFIRAVEASEDLSAEFWLSVSSAEYTVVNIHHSTPEPCMNHLFSRPEHDYVIQLSEQNHVSLVAQPRRVLGPELSFEETLWRQRNSTPASLITPVYTLRVRRKSLDENLTEFLERKTMSLELAGRIADQIPKLIEFGRMIVREACEEIERNQNRQQELEDLSNDELERLLASSIQVNRDLRLRLEFEEVMKRRHVLASSSSSQ